MKDTYLYPAVFEYAADGISIEFPDLPGCLPCGMTTEEAVKNAKEALALHLYGMEQDGESIPEPSDPAMLAKDVFASAYKIHRLKSAVISGT